MAFGAQMFEWQLFSSLIAFQAKIQDEDLLVQRYAYQEHERVIENRVKVLSIFTALVLVLV